MAPSAGRVATLVCGQLTCSLPAQYVHAGLAHLVCRIEALGLLLVCGLLRVRSVGVMVGILCRRSAAAICASW